MRILSLRGCSEAELLTKLLRAGYPRAEATAAVQECVKHHFLDDELLAEDCTSLWQSRGHGVRSICYKLRKRGVPAEIAESALADAGESESEIAIQAIESRLPSLLRENDGRKRRAKALRFLAGRGFSSPAISAAMKRLTAAVNEVE